MQLINLFYVTFWVYIGGKIVQYKIIQQLKYLRLYSASPIDAQAPQLKVILFADKTGKLYLVPQKPYTAYSTKQKCIDETKKDLEDSIHFLQAILNNPCIENIAKEKQNFEIISKSLEEITHAQN